MPAPAAAELISMIYARGKAASPKSKQEEFSGGIIGRFLQRIDKALPEKHARKLYNALNRRDAAILV